MLKYEKISRSSKDVLSSFYLSFMFRLSVRVSNNWNSNRGLFQRIIQGREIT